MNAKFFPALCAAALVASRADASMIVGDLIDNASAAGVNLEVHDDSQEHYADNGDNKVSVGDVIYGWAHIASTSPPGSGVSLGNEVYALFSETITSLPDPGNAFQGALSATSLLSPFSLEAISGRTLAELGAGAVVAVFEKPAGFSQVPLTGAGATVLGGSLSIGNPITGGQYDFAAGISGVNDFFRYSLPFLPVGGANGWQTNINELNIPAGAGLPGVPSSTTIGNFVSGFSITGTGAAFDEVINPTVTNTDPSTGLSHLYQVAISNGGFKGTNGLSPKAIDANISNTVTADVGQEAPATVPEPSTLVIWTVLAGSFAGFRARRRRVAT